MIEDETCQVFGNLTDLDGTREERARMEEIRGQLQSLADQIDGMRRRL
jgi:hypothetical protein